MSQPRSFDRDLAYGRAAERGLLRRITMANNLVHPKALPAITEDLTRPHRVDGDADTRVHDYLDLERRRLFGKLTADQQLEVLEGIWKGG